MAIVAVCIARSVALSAHGQESLGAEALHRWTWEPITLALLAASAALYVRGASAIWRRAGVDHGIRIWQAAAFGAGLLSIAAALISPIAWLSGILFSVHMTQHEILMLVSAPLVVFGHPLLAVLWAVPPSTRWAWGRWTQSRPVARTWHWLTGAARCFPAARGRDLGVAHAATVRGGAAQRRDSRARASQLCRHRGTLLVGDGARAGTAGSATELPCCTYS